MSSSVNEPVINDCLSTNALSILRIDDNQQTKQVGDHEQIDYEQQSSEVPATNESNPDVNGRPSLGPAVVENLAVYCADFFSVDQADILKGNENSA